MGVRFNAKYDWDKWFRRKRFTLVRGKDYSCSQGVMAQQIRTAAHRRGFYVSLVEGEGTFTVIVREEKANASAT